VTHANALITKELAFAVVEVENVTNELHFYSRTKKWKVLKQLHRYTRRSVHKIVCFDVFLISALVSLGITSKDDLQRLAEW